MKLTQHFSLEELTRSEIAARRGIANVPPPIVLANLTMLCWYVLEPLRAAVGSRPILINSGYRSEALNRAVDGAESSLHRLGRAADIVVGGLLPREVAEIAVRAKLPMTEVIVEFGVWTHISVGEPGRAAEMRVMTASRSADGTVAYTKGVA